MLALAAANLGLRTHIYSPDGGPDGKPGHSPAGQVAHSEMIANYDDLQSIADFGDVVDAATYEFENVPAATAAELANHTRLFPDARALDVAQDRLSEKTFLTDIGEKTAPFRNVESLDDLTKAVSETGLPAVLKTRRFGYDGKGQTIIRDKAELEEAWKLMKDSPSILEGFIPFEKEISVIAARSVGGDIVVYTPGENIHENHILATTLVPARISEDTDRSARTAAENVIQSLNYVGVIGIEFFVLPSGDLLINEIAPRVHNSGHWTEAACTISQFELHIRAVAGWPLVDPYRHSDARMENLIGQDVERWKDLSHQDKTFITLYGKTETREGRKMGHVTKLYPRDELER